MIGKATDSIGELALTADNFRDAVRTSEGCVWRQESASSKASLENPELQASHRNVRWIQL